MTGRYTAPLVSQIYRIVERVISPAPAFNPAAAGFLSAPPRQLIGLTNFLVCGPPPGFAVWPCRAPESAASRVQMPACPLTGP